MNIFELTTLLILSLHVFHSDSISVENIAIQNFKKTPLNLCIQTECLKWDIFGNFETFSWFPQGGMFEAMFQTTYYKT